MSVSPAERQKTIAALRAQIAAVPASNQADGGNFLPLGAPAIDRALAGGGLASDALHEIAAASADLACGASAVSFLAGLAGRFAAHRSYDVFWISTEDDLFAPGLAQHGLPPERVIHLRPRDEKDALACAEECLRHGSVGAVMVETAKLEMTAARRLQLSAEAGGTPCLMLRKWRRNGDCPLAMPSPAVTRWRVSVRPSTILPCAGIGRARWQLELTKQRGGTPATWDVEAWNADAQLGSAERSDRGRDLPVEQRSVA